MAKRAHFGSVRKLPSGRFQASYWHKATRHAAPDTFRTKGDAQAWLSGVETDIRRGAWVNPWAGRQTLAYWADRWLATTVHLRATTRRGYEMALRTHVLPTFGDEPVSRIDQPAVRAWVAELAQRGSAPGTIAGARKVLRLVLGTAVEANALAANPCDRVKVPRGPREEMHFLSADQVEALADAVEHPPVRRAGHGATPTGRHHFPEYAALIRLAAYSGLRAGEIAGLRVRRLDLLRGRVEVAETLTDVDGTLVSNATTKSGKVRTVPIPKFIADELAPLLAGKTPDDYVFTSPEGGPLRNSNFYRRLFRPGVERAGLPGGVRFHDLRHTYAGFLIAEGAHPKAIMERMGHSSITVTLDRYGHLLPSLEEHLTNALDVSGRAAQQGPALDRARIAHDQVTALRPSTRK
ncbi:MAG TPA: site-specific integrase [Acidimicrobiales bacterium]|nr:site-specific integrase [Acidimicrobiales bacterium]